MNTQRTFPIAALTLLLACSNAHCMLRHAVKRLAPTHTQVTNMPRCTLTPTSLFANRLQAPALLARTFGTKKLGINKPINDNKPAIPTDEQLRKQAEHVKLLAHEAIKSLQLTPDGEVILIYPELAKTLVANRYKNLQYQYNPKKLSALLAEAQKYLDLHLHDDVRSVTAKNLLQELIDAKGQKK